jgi:hypothetical protein
MNGSYSVRICVFDKAKCQHKTKAKLLLWDKHSVCHEMLTADKHAEMWRKKLGLSALKVQTCTKGAGYIRRELQANKCKFVELERDPAYKLSQGLIKKFHLHHIPKSHKRP